MDKPSTRVSEILAPTFWSIVQLIERNVNRDDLPRSTQDIISHQSRVLRHLRTILPKLNDDDARHSESVGRHLKAVQAAVDELVPKLEALQDDHPQSSDRTQEKVWETELDRISNRLHSSIEAIQAVVAADTQTDLTEDGSDNDTKDPISEYILIHSRELLKPQERKDLSELGLNFLEYISNKTYLYRRHGVALAKVRQQSYVASADIYPLERKVVSGLKEAQERGQPHTDHKVDIIFHKDVRTDSKDLRDTIANTAHVSPDRLEISETKARLRVEQQYITDLTSIDQVRMIENVLKSEYRSNIARQILNVEAYNDPTKPNKYEGMGEVIAVADTGFDRGNIRYTHSAFATGYYQFQHRVLALYPMSEFTSLSDVDGHGTHVCGLAVGNGHVIDPTTRLSSPFKGTAPEAKLVVQCLGHDFSGEPDDLTQLFRIPYENNNARVHTNSWGSTWSGYQECYRRESSFLIDKFVWEHPSLVICWAAGNDGGKGHQQIGAEAAAKNCITVGASKNDLNRKDQICDKSSRGPTKEGRHKPDLVAPGDKVLSAASSHHQYRTRDTRRESDTGESDTRWRYMGGTSMACPLVAGCAAVLREAVKDGHTIEPSAALVKAILINGAVPFAASINGFDPSAGFGRVDLANSIHIARLSHGTGFRQEQLASEPDEKVELIEMPEQPVGSNRLKVTLVWSDPPGLALQNQLYLLVRASDGTEYSTEMNLIQDDLDVTNNVQQLILDHLPTGNTEIIVRAFHILQLDANGYQPYACVWRIY